MLGNRRMRGVGRARRWGVVFVAASTLVALLVRPAQGRIVAQSALPGAAPLENAGAPVAYRGGPLMLSSSLFLIFWGPEGGFPSAYTDPLIQFADDLHADQNLTSDVFSVTELYTNAVGTHISGDVTLGAVKFDTTSYPAPDAEEGCEANDCLTALQIRSEIRQLVQSESWPMDPIEAPQAQYLLYTPPGVTVCIGPGDCSVFSEHGFCSYHGQVTWIGITHALDRVATYSVLPYLPICDPGGAPAEVDSTLNEEIHEIVESATDPEGTGYLDSEGHEVADKCVYPLTEAFPAAFGPLLGTTPSEGPFNQLIHGHPYYLQDIWSNAAGCVPRIGPTPSFAPPTRAYAGQTIDFDASGSYDLSTPVASYAWNYGDGSAVQTTSLPSTAHVYASPGTYQVSLIVSDASGSANASTQTQPITIAVARAGGSETGDGSPGGGSQGGSAPPPSSGSGRPPPRSKPGGLTRAEKLSRALRRCRKLSGRRRARCAAAARGRFGARHSQRSRARRRRT